MFQRMKGMYTGKYALFTLTAVHLVGGVANLLTVGQNDKR